MNQLLVVVYLDGKRDVLQLDPDTRLQKFVLDGVLNVRGSFQNSGGFQWYYFPVCNIRHYSTQEGTL